MIGAEQRAVSPRRRILGGNTAFGFVGMPSPLSVRTNTMHPTLALVAPLLLMAAQASPVFAQQAGVPGGGGVARAEAHANATNGESRTATHRVVVVNGKTVVDERTESGKPIGGGAGGFPVPMPGCASADDMLRQLQEQVARDMAAQGGGLPMPPDFSPPALPSKPAAQPRPPVVPRPTAQPLPPVVPRPSAQPLPPVGPRPAAQPRPPVEPRPAAQPRPPVAPPRGLQPRPPAVPRPAKPSRG